MILEAAGAAFVRLFSAEFRRLFLKSLGLTLLILVVLWIALERLVSTLALPWIGALLPGSGGWDSWFGLIAGILAGLALALGLALLIGPVTAIVAGFFLDDVAEIIEREDYPADPPGQPLPWAQALGQSMKFFAGVVVRGRGRASAPEHAARCLRSAFERATVRQPCACHSRWSVSTKSRPPR